MDDWTDLLANIPSDITREDVEAIGLIVEMAERDYENHQQHHLQRPLPRIASILSKLGEPKERKEK
jgi:hypothetical protein